VIKGRLAPLDFATASIPFPIPHGGPRFPAGACASPRMVNSTAGPTCKFRRLERTRASFSLPICDMSASGRWFPAIRPGWLSRCGEPAWHQGWTAYRFKTETVARRTTTERLLSTRFTNRGNELSSTLGKIVVTSLFQWAGRYGMNSAQSRLMKRLIKGMASAHSGTGKAACSGSTTRFVRSDAENG
jgi:hypothetical protein